MSPREYVHVASVAAAYLWSRLQLLPVSSVLLPLSCQDLVPLGDAGRKLCPEAECRSL